MRHMDEFITSLITTKGHRLFEEPMIRTSRINCVPVEKLHNEILEMEFM